MRLARSEEYEGIYTPRHHAEERKRESHQQAYMDVNKWPTIKQFAKPYAVLPRRVNPKVILLSNTWNHTRVLRELQDI